jgi:hypothetical protein
VSNIAAVCIEIGWLTACLCLTSINAARRWRSSTTAASIRAITSWSRSTCADGEPGLNDLCAGFMAFFKHIDSDAMMADLLRQGRYADEAMAML